LHYKNLLLPKLYMITKSVGGTIIIKPEESLVRSDSNSEQDATVPTIFWLEGTCESRGI